MKFRTKPFEIEAVHFTGDNYDEVVNFTSPKITNVITSVSVTTGGGFRRIDRGDGITAEVYDYLHNTWVGVKKGQWIIKGNKGEFYPCDAEIFEAKYERIEDEG
jgi:hypothetical protein